MDVKLISKLARLSSLRKVVDKLTKMYEFLHGNITKFERRRWYVSEGKGLEECDIV